MSLQSNLRPLSALAHPTRWRIVALLLDRPLCVSDLAAILDLQLSNLSNHLKLLRECGVLRVERRGSLCFYRLDDRLHGVISSMHTAFELSAACDSVLGADAWKAQASFRA